MNMDEDEFSRPVHGTLPQNLIEKIVRMRVYESQFWREYCFGLTAELLIDRAVELKYFGGASSELSRPTPFLCLLLKMLQIQPDFDIVQLMINKSESLFKYMRVLALFYLRLVGTPLQIYKTLEPIYEDFRKVRYELKNGWKLMYMDEVVHDLLTEPVVCNIQLPRLPKRVLLINSQRLPKRISPLQKELDDYEQFEDQFKEYFNVDNISLSDTSDIILEEVESKQELRKDMNVIVPKKRKKSKKKGKSKMIKGLKMKNFAKKKEEEAEEQGSSSKPNEAEEFSVEYWNEQRKKLGLKPLE